MKLESLKKEPFPTESCFVHFDAPIIVRDFRVLNVQIYHAWKDWKPISDVEKQSQPKVIVYQHTPSGKNYSAVAIWNF